MAFAAGVGATKFHDAEISVVGAEADGGHPLLQQSQPDETAGIVADHTSATAFSFKPESAADRADDP